jgi:putative aminopeptidase FrvX
MNDLLRDLTEAAGVSGTETEARLLIRDLIAKDVDNWHVDAMGNLIACKTGTGESGLSVMLDAHMDEVGLMITDIESSGLLKFSTVGGIDDRTLLGLVVEIGPKKVNGVIGSRPIHLTTTSQRKRIIKSDAMRIDIGAATKNSAAKKISIGDTATFVSAYRENGKTAVSKAFDDRVGCAVVIELLRGGPYPFDLYAAFTVQEEVGLRGTQVAAYAIKPDVAFVIECTPAYDLPTEEDISANVVLGRGPAVYVMDRVTIQDPRLVSHVMRTAEAEDIPFQIRQPGGGGTNTAMIQTVHGGVPAATIAVPGRHAHTPNMLISLQDYANTISLMEAVLAALSPSMLKRD